MQGCQCPSAALGQRVRMRSAPDLSAALVLLSRDGVNLNHIARTLNAEQAVAQWAELEV